MNTVNCLSGVLLIVALASSCSSGARADTPRDGGDQALRQAQYLLKKLAGEKEALEKENLRLSEELKKVQEELAGTSKQLSASEERKAQEQQRNVALVERVRGDSERLSNLQSSYRKEIGEARADIKLLKNAVLERESWISDCRAKNEGLYKTNGELLQAYKNKSAWDVLSQHEPVTGIASVKMENFVQEYQFRLEDLHTVRFVPGVQVPESLAAH
jgi:chromosome segregation ATPase